MRAFVSWQQVTAPTLARQTGDKPDEIASSLLLAQESRVPPSAPPTQLIPASAGAQARTLRSEAALNIGVFGVDQRG